MSQYDDLFRQVYELGELFGVGRRLPANPLTRTADQVRPNSIAIEGGAFGDEGKGKCVDYLCAQLLRRHSQVVVYRWNGGSNAGHTVVVQGRSFALHQLPSGIFSRGATVILGRGMVVHPGDLVTEMQHVAALAGGTMPTTVLVDQLAVLSLDTHRALESVLKRWEAGGKGATGRGISPAYADVLLRHPVRMRDLTSADWEERLSRHYELYAAMVRGLGGDLATTSIPLLTGGTQQVGTPAEFIARLGRERIFLQRHIQDVYPFLDSAWNRSDMPFVFEGAQAAGLDPRFGAYPDVTASDPTFSGILNSTEGLIQPEQIAVRAGTIKATYTSSVGTRRLPTLMEENLAHRIREDAHEYGATTRRPRDIAHIDLPCLAFLARVTGMEYLILTHLDISYPEIPIKVCTYYTDASGSVVPYRPDQEYLSAVQAHYIELPSWDGMEVCGRREIGQLPVATQQYIAFLSQALHLTPLLGTTGPEREALVSWIPD